MLLRKIYDAEVELKDVINLEKNPEKDNEEKQRLLDACIQALARLSLPPNYYSYDYSDLKDANISAELRLEKIKIISRCAIVLLNQGAKIKDPFYFYSDDEKPYFHFGTFRLEFVQKFLRHILKTQYKDIPYHQISDVLYMRAALKEQYRGFQAARSLYVTSGAMGTPEACVKIGNQYSQQKDFQRAYDWYQTAAEYSGKKLVDVLGVNQTIELFSALKGQNMPKDFAEQVKHQDISAKNYLLFATLLFKESKDYKSAYEYACKGFIKAKNNPELCRQAALDIKTFLMGYFQSQSGKSELDREIIENSQAPLSETKSSLPLTDHSIYTFFEAQLVQRTLQLFEGNFDRLEMLELNKKDIHSQSETVFAWCQIACSFPDMLDYVGCLIKQGEKSKATLNELLTAYSAKKLMLYVLTHKERLDLSPEGLVAISQFHLLALTDGKKAIAESKEEKSENSMHKFFTSKMSQAVVQPKDTLLVCFARK